jgi:hypothetical protein
VRLYLSQETSDPNAFQVFLKTVLAPGPHVEYMPAPSAAGAKIGSRPWLARQRREEVDGPRGVRAGAEPDSVIDVRAIFQRAIALTVDKMPLVLLPR